MRLLVLPALSLAATDAFVPGWMSSAKRPTSLAFSSLNIAEQQSYSSTVLFAKKNKKAVVSLDFLENLEEEVDLDQPLSLKEQKELAKKKKKEEKAAAAAAPASSAKNTKAAALDALDDMDDMDQPLSKKEQKALLKQQQKEQKEEEPAVVNGAAEEQPQTNGAAEPTKNMSKKEEMLMKALEMEELDSQRGEASSEDDQPKLSKKELKALKKKEEKMAAKAEAKAAKKAERAADLEDTEIEVTNGDSLAAPAAEPSQPADKIKLTLEDKIRKERPPPRIRVMEGAQPGYISLRLENVGITFRNQEVLKDVTWGVQSAERIGLVGKNGAGKTTQLRILSGELEPTTGDVVKSSADLRTAILRQEFVDELVKERTLKEEFMSVFEEENQLLLDLKEAESNLANMGEDDTEAMQEILDRMQDLQRKADDKDVYVLESKVKKIMDLMGFNDDEGDDLVASFSGGWKMRIGLGKVLLKDPNVLLLGKSRFWFLSFGSRFYMFSRESYV